MDSQTEIELFKLGARSDKSEKRTLPKHFFLK